jgi:hypothetical protein
MVHKSQSKLYSVDGLMRNVARTLIRDFRDCLDDPTFCNDHYAALSVNDIGAIRSSVPALDFTCSNPYRFKADYQMNSLLKRYRFEKDLFSENELIESSIEKFMSVQTHIANHSITHVSAFTDRVLDGAAIYIAKVLGVYSDEEHRNLCRFGRRASVGIPARLACEAARWELPISGSLEQISWFDSEMSQVDCVQKYWASQRDSDLHRSIYQETSSLKLTLVPKTFKSLRAIMPNTTIGSYMSFGLGEMIRSRLKGIGYDISTLQMRHRSLARRGSVHTMYTTADLSSASDTVSVELIDRLFPDDWRNILHASRIGVVELPNGCRVESQTFCTMGVGYTFPLQTLVFLSLLKSLSAILYKRRRHTISVYGDDMIYPSPMHSEVVTLFEEVGFMINIDKTYHEGHFRESCGGDYCYGVDVRPFQPRNDQATVGQKAYEAILYKYVNNLLTRWSEYEIKETLDYLLSEVGRVTGSAKVVPVDYPDDSGIKCPSLHHWAFLSQRSDVSKPKYIGHGLFRFSYLRLCADSREEKRHEPYFWLGLRGLDLVVDSYHHGSSPARRPGYLQEEIDTFLNVRGCEPSLTWKVHHDLTTRSKLTGRRLRRLVSVVTVSHTGCYKRQSGTSGFEDRRLIAL